MRKPSQPRDAGGLGREVAARLRVQAERERRIAEIERHFAARGLRAGVHDQVIASHHGGQPAAHLLDQRVTGMMTQAVIDDLEAVQVDEHDREPAAGPAVPFDRLFQPIQKRLLSSMPPGTSRATCVKQTSWERGS